MLSLGDQVSAREVSRISSLSECEKQDEIKRIVGSSGVSNKDGLHAVLTLYYRNPDRYSHVPGANIDNWKHDLLPDERG